MGIADAAGAMRLAPPSAVAATRAIFRERIGAPSPFPRHLGLNPHRKFSQRRCREYESRINLAFNFAVRFAMHKHNDLTGRLRRA
jgi:hypothetical protein